MATCQKKLRPSAYSGDTGATCGAPAEYLCTIPDRYTRHGREPKHIEYRCEAHKEGECVRIIGGKAIQPFKGTSREV